MGRCAQLLVAFLPTRSAMCSVERPSSMRDRTWPRPNWNSFLPLLHGSRRCTWHKLARRSKGHWQTFVRSCPASIVMLQTGNFSLLEMTFCALIRYTHPSVHAHCTGRPCTRSQDVHSFKETKSTCEFDHFCAISKLSAAPYCECERRNANVRNAATQCENALRVSLSTHRCKQKELHSFVTL